MKLINVIFAAIVATLCNVFPAATQYVDTSTPKLYALPPNEQAEKGSRAGEADNVADIEEAGSRVVGGTVASHIDWPSLVYVAIESKDGNTMCGGTIISPEWVLTAGHCIQPGIKRIAIFEGTANLESKNEGRIIFVNKYIRYEKYEEKPESHNDIALLKLSRRAISRPQILLGQSAKDILFSSPKMAMVAGFGLTSAQAISGEHHGNTSNRLRQTTLPLVGRTECTKVLNHAMGANLDAVIDDATICAGDTNGGRDSCSGDSGGPLSIEIDGRKKVQIGVVSWGPGCAQKNTVGVYASVAHFQDWIKSYVKDAVFYESSPSTPTNAPTSTSETTAPVRPPSVAEVETLAQSIGIRPEIEADLFEGAKVQIGMSIHFRVRSAIPGQLFLYNVDLATGAAYQIFPNKYSFGSGGGQASYLIDATTPVSIPASSDRFAFRVKEPLGKSRLYAFVLPKDMRLSDLAARGLDMSDIPDAAALFRELAQRVEHRGVDVVPVASGARQGANRFEYEVVP